MQMSSEILSHRLRIVGIGMIVLDIILSNGDETPIFRAGGTCGNVLAGLSFLGWDSIAISRAGTDLAGRIMIKDLTLDGVNTAYISRENNVATPRIVEKLKSNGEYAKHSFLMRCPTCKAFLPRFRSPKIDIIDSVFKAEPKTDVFFFDKITPSTLKLARQYRNSGSLVFFEPSNLKKLDNIEQGLAFCHVMKFAIDDIKIKNCAVDEAKILELVESYNPDIVIRTLGEKGLSYRLSGDNQWHNRRSLKPCELHDTCGAGDWATVGFLLQLDKLSQDSRIDLLKLIKQRDFVEQALKVALCLSSLSCMFVGARGLSYSLDKKNILEIIENCLTSDITQNTSFKSSIEQSKNYFNYLIKYEKSLLLCDTCILETNARSHS